MMTEIFHEYWGPFAHVASAALIFLAGFLAGQRRKAIQDDIANAILADYEAQERATAAFHRHLVSLFFAKREPTTPTEPLMARVKQAFQHSTILDKYPFPMEMHWGKVRWKTTAEADLLFALLLFAELGIVIPSAKGVGKYGEVQ